MNQCDSASAVGRSRVSAVPMCEPLDKALPDRYDGVDTNRQGAMAGMPAQTVHLSRTAAPASAMQQPRPREARRRSAA